MACRLRDILSRRVDTFRRALRGDPPARVEPMRVHLKPQAQAVKARPRRYDPVKVRSAVHSPCDADDSLPSVDVIRAAQRKA